MGVGCAADRQVMVGQGAMHCKGLDLLHSASFLVGKEKLYCLRVLYRLSVLSDLESCTGLFPGWHLFASSSCCTVKQESWMNSGFKKKKFCWSIVDLQCCVSFRGTAKWISYTYTYIPIFPPSCVSCPPSLSHPSSWSQSTELISLCYAAASH